MDARKPIPHPMLWDDRRPAHGFRRMRIRCPLACRTNEIPHLGYEEA